MQISLWKSNSIISCCLLFFIFGFVVSWLSGQRSVSPWFVLFIAPCAIWLVIYGSISANEKELKLNSVAGKYTIDWADIDRIEKGQSLIVFFHGEKRLSLPLACFWSGKEKKNLIQIIESVIEESEIEVKETFRADFLIPKGTKHNQSTVGNG